MRKRADASKYLIAAVAIALFAAAAVSQTTPQSNTATQQSAEDTQSSAPTRTPTTPDSTSTQTTESASNTGSQDIARETDRVPTPTQRSTTPAAQAQTPRCAHLTGIPKAECERRDTHTDDLPAGVTPAQRERQALRDENAAKSGNDTK